MSPSKIPCSVAIITRGEGLKGPLEALKDFGEIIICHGNPAPEHLEVAKEYGAVLIRQYDTDEPNLTCVTDKAAVRERAMAASTLPWRFFMDRDDRLSPELIQEIRSITTDPAPKHLIWRMPTRIFIDGKEVQHEATYPSYQTRLVHESVGATFKGAVHERLKWDEKRFPVGTMQNRYNFQWSPERVQNFSKYLGGYATREIMMMHFGSFGNFVYFGLYKRARTIAGYLLWRLPAMYLRWGFKNSMPLGIELTIVAYHIKLFFGSIGAYLRYRRWYILLRETLRGKDVNRIVGNIALQPHEAYGRVLDVGGGEDPSYWRFLQQHRWHRRISVDLAQAKPTVVANLEVDTLPLADAYCDTALMCNVLEHVNNRAHMLGEVRRVLRPGGTLIGIIPFLVAVHPDPHDYVRFTDEGLRALLIEAGFTDVAVTPIGRGPITASYSQSEFLLPRVLKLVILPLVLGLDRLILTLRPGWRAKFPLSYLFVAR